ncbi:MAG TPA: hypothetical protein VIV60_25285 [Polyangiaceae bacterium]
MSDVIELVVSATLQIVMTCWVIRRDDRQLTGPSAARGFPPATFWIAVVVFGPLSIPIHFIRTRRSWVGLGLGAIWLAGTIGLIGLAGFALSLILE